MQKILVVLLSVYNVNNVFNQHNPIIHNTFIWKPSVWLYAYLVLVPTSSAYPASVFSAAQDWTSWLLHPGMATELQQ